MTLHRGDVSNKSLRKGKPRWRDDGRDADLVPPEGATDAVAHWSVADRGLCGDRVLSLVIAGGEPSVVFACTGGEGGGVYRTADRGASREKVSGKDQ